MALSHKKKIKIAIRDLKLLKKTRPHLQETLDLSINLLERELLDAKSNR